MWLWYLLPSQLIAVFPILQDNLWWVKVGTLSRKNGLCYVSIPCQIKLLLFIYPSFGIYPPHPFWIHKSFNLSISEASLCISEWDTIQEMSFPRTFKITGIGHFGKYHGYDTDKSAGCLKTRPLENESLLVFLCSSALTFHPLCTILGI